jgi:hypothetical protein
LDSGDREGALTLLVELLTGGGRTAQSVPEVAANALVATARAEGERDDADQAALAEYRGAALARDEIVALILEAPLATDDLVAIQQALVDRLARDHATRQAAAPHVLEAAARRQTELAFAGREGRVLAAKLGRGYLRTEVHPEPQHRKGTWALPVFLDGAVPGGLTNCGDVADQVAGLMRHLRMG